MQGTDLGQEVLEFGQVRFNVKGAIRALCLLQVDQLTQPRRICT